MSTLKGRVTTVVIGALAAVGLVFGGIAIAGFQAPVTKTGGPLLQTKVATQSAAWTINDPSGWVTVPTSELEVTVPNGEKRLVVATFNAESSCSASGYCSVRIVAQKSGVGPQQLHPRAGTEYAYDSASAGWDAHTAMRMAKLGPGKWTIWVQAGMDGTGGFRLDDWLFKVDVHK